MFFVHNKKKVQYTRTVATSIEMIYSSSGCISKVCATVHPYSAKVSTHKTEIERCGFKTYYSVITSADGVGARGE